MRRREERKSTGARDGVDVDQHVKSFVKEEGAEGRRLDPHFQDGREGTQELDVMRMEGHHQGHRPHLARAEADLLEQLTLF